MFRSDKRYSLLGLLIDYEENKVLWIQSQESYYQQFIPFVIYEWAK